ncbi:hypothetical protein OOZ15_11415 [Galbibacter sp. EGI 63066]|uniref:hypothetical protein n=1 Tax=Galbibacter sp. EGI 63066 TaxID=2993559 RepID=UPI0022499CB3|nr:hypothetical protein [Galbibacter sp. EGI 63066]MCX2680551.1 hypothetical protein [Galbibacter sp. EGI 63066]
MKERDELKVLKETPISLKAEITKEDNFYITINTETKKIGGFVAENRLNDLWDEFDPSLRPLNPYAVKLDYKKLKGLEFKCLYWRDILYEMEVNDKIIIPYQKRKASVGIVMLSIGMLSLAFQSWIVYTLITKGKKGFFKMFK